MPDYQGFSVAIYEPDATGLELSNLVELTGTELPDLENNGISRGLAPNSRNINPFNLSNSSEGRYNFLFDPQRPLESSANAGLRQTQTGAAYILVVKPPADSSYRERRIRLEILASTGSVNNNILRYQATALDGIPLSATGGVQLSDTVVEVFNAETEGLNLFSLAFGSVMCESDQIAITKTASRASAELGDTVIYRLLIRNLVNTTLTNIVIDDILPVGFQLIPDSSFSKVDGVPIQTDVQFRGSTIVFSPQSSLQPDQTMEVVYGAQLTPASLRGDGTNSAAVKSRRSDNDLLVQDGPSIHRVLVEPGIVSDCGTLIGRVFEDKNFDGEQQRGEAGIPNAVIFLEDGNRITSDADGLFHVQCLLPGYHSGALDMTSLPGYAVAPNLYVRERNSQSRMVNLSPGGLVRMNFGVTPISQEETNDD